jgi:dTDP-4-dehydrorhamnose reductase
MGVADARLDHAFGDAAYTAVDKAELEEEELAVMVNGKSVGIPAAGSNSRSLLDGLRVRRH